MTDIIERLQAEIERTVTLDLLHQEAANEIASLRANITTMEAAARDAIEMVRKEKDAEILRLRVEHHEDTAILHETIAEQKRRIAKLEEDAARYQWLRDVGDETWPPFAKRAGLSVAKIDAAIDAAMKDKP